MIFKFQKMSRILISTILIVALTISTQAANAQPTLHSNTQELLNSETRVSVSADKLTRTTAYKFFLNNTQLTVSDPVINYNNRIYLPLRAIAEELGVTVDYYSKEKVAVLELEKTKVELPLEMNKGVIIRSKLDNIDDADKDASVVYLDKENKDIVAFVYNNKVYIPLRFISEVLGFTVIYRDTENKIYFKSTNVGEQSHSSEKSYSFRTKELLNSHYQKHGSEFGDISIEAYLIGANNLINSSPSDVLIKYEKGDGDKIFYSENTNEFLVLSPDGYIRTYFKPDDGIKYYNRQ